MIGKSASSLLLVMLDSVACLCKRSWMVLIFHQNISLILIRSANCKFISEAGPELGFINCFPCCTSVWGGEAPKAYQFCLAQLSQMSEQSVTFGKPFRPRVLCRKGLKQFALRKASRVVTITFLTVFSLSLSLPAHRKTH